MKSIQARYLFLVLAAILVSVIVVGAIAIATAVSRSDEDAVSIINLTCQTEAQYINATLDSIEDSVSVEVSYAESRLESVGRFLADEEYREQYTDEVERLFLDIANDTDGAVSFYFRYNAETVESTQGFLYTRDSADEPFYEIALTDLSLYDADDDEHVGWYYIPLRNGQATWLDPYQNKNLGIYMISYVVPVFVDGEFIGVVGMDVNFQVIIDQLLTIHPFNSGFAFLASSEGVVLFHPELEYGTQIDDVARADDAAFSEELSRGTNGNKLVCYTVAGERRNMAFRGLRNGMLLVLVANEADIDANRNAMVFNISVAAAVIAVLMMLVAVAFGRRALRPLNELTESARQVASGNLDVTIPEARTTEVKTLIEAYSVTVDRMREQLAYIDELAHHDGLTSLWNKSAYDERVAALNEAVEQGGARFGIVMIDVNDLKLINDTYGHEHGDDYLLTAVRTIRAAFPQETVYRIGGDEFVVVVEGDGLDALDGRLAELDASNAQPVDPDKPWEHTLLAFGAAHFDAAVDQGVHDVFERADAAMYAKKQQMKASRS